MMFRQLMFALGIWGNLERGKRISLKRAWWLAESCVGHRLRCGECWLKHIDGWHDGRVS